MQALSFAVHIPLVCFGIAFPVMVLLADSLHLRTGDPAYRVLAQRWTRVMLALFAAALIWIVSLASYEPGDPVWFFSTGSHEAAANFAGRVGAFGGRPGRWSSGKWSKPSALT